MVTEIIWLLISGIGAYLMLNLYALLISDRLLFRPREASYHHLPNEVRIPQDSGSTLTAVYLEHPSPRCTLLFSHGNAEDLGNVVPFMQPFHECGCSVLMYDYSGYGTSKGRPSTARVKQNAAAAYRWLINENGIDPKTIISHGRSLGGAVAVWLAARHETGGVITEVSFASAFRVKTRLKILPWDKFDSLKAVRRIHSPILVIHGTGDEIIPEWHGRKVFAAANKPKQHLWIPGGSHFNYAYINEQEYLNTIMTFIGDSIKNGRRTT
ncbi:MAG: alpha/beta hydrolase [Pontiellaceae bacterium]|nr:alpha/beta hydrolase [Pontiellaceae bacterium]MBN2785416.1 alpha/beta hydrolase [Pontiellaceae bacterium]